MKHTTYLILCLLVFSLCVDENDIHNIDGWQKIIQKQKFKYPHMQVVDLYKLIYQGVLGPAHLGTNPDTILRYIESELECIHASQEAKIVEYISPSKKYVRINLRKFKAKGGNPELLADAIVLSAINSDSDIKNFIYVWNEVGKLIESGDLLFDKAKFRDFNDFVVKNNFPLVHHSQEYIENYSPSYRVVENKYWNELFGKIFE